MSDKICGVSKRHFRRLVENEMKNKRKCLNNVNQKQNLGENCGKNEFHLEIDVNNEEESNELGLLDLENSFTENIKIGSEKYENGKLENKIRVWSMKNNISHKALTELLILLNENGIIVPRNARSVLKTPREVITVKKVDPGEYYHYGIKNSLKTLPNINNIKHPIQIDIGIDGLPISKSSNLCLWPILGSVVCKEFDFPPFPIGIYLGYQKPNNADEFLTEFVAEYKDLSDAGHIKLRIFTCDAPARSFISGIQGHQGFHGCSKCNQVGTYMNNRVVYKSERGNTRTDESFKKREDINHHSSVYKNQLSILEKVGIRMISQFPLEPMHLLDLGIVKKLICAIFNNKCVFHLTYEQKQMMSNKLISLGKFLPVEFVRKPRTMNELSKWKATEFRQLILYTGIVVFQNVLDSDVYYHFILLHCAYRLLACPINYAENAECAQEMLDDFVKYYSILYNEDQISYNVHSLLHLSTDCKLHGPLDSFSAYKFENYMQHLKSIIRKPTKVLQQLHKRFKESVENVNASKKIGPEKLIKTEKNIKYFLEMHYNSFKLTTKSPNNYCCIQADGERIPIQITEILEINREFILKGKRFLDLNSYFQVPIDSSNGLGIIISNSISNEDAKFDSRSVIYKYVCLPFPDEKKLLIPLLHTC